MRNQLDKQLDALNTSLIEMGGLCESAIASAAKALTTGDASLAKDAIRFDKEIDRIEREIEHMCLKLLLRQQPVASDLRLISAALKMITDMERIGDQASDIAELVLIIIKELKPGASHIEEMATATIGMVTDSLDAFVRRDLQLARQVIDDDDVVDELFCKVKGEIVDFISQNGKMGEFAVDLLMIAKYFERIGDHATNIAEWVEFSIVGVHREDETI